jgi:hypothetical protein
MGEVASRRAIAAIHLNILVHLRLTPTSSSETALNGDRSRSYGQAGNYRFVRRISTDKRACVYQLNST